MKFGKLSNIEDVDFKLPKDPEINQMVLDGAETPKSKHLYIGCTGWSMKEWVGKVYPKGTKSSAFLKAYARQFNTIELNTTHYRIPDFKTIDKWRNESEPDFKFCPKIPQRISHSRDLGLSSPQLRLFWDSIAGLEEKLGCCFIQLPPHFNSNKLPLLEQFLAEWPRSIPLAVELRHESWFVNENARMQFLKLLNKYDKCAVITDVAGRRDVLHMGLSNTTCMLRFVGNALHPTDYTRIDEWINRLKQWFANGLEQVYFFPHEPDNLLAPDLAAYLHSKSHQIPELISRGPNLNDPEGEQLSLFG